MRDELSAAASDERRAVLRLGDREVELVDGTFRTSLDALPEARLVVEPDCLLAQPLDYLAPAEVEFDDDVAFSGSVVEAQIVGDEVRILCQEGISLRDTLMPEMVAQCPHTEVVYAVARGAGFAPSHIHIGGPEPAIEPIEVMVPVLGLETDQAVSIGDVRILPSDAGTIMARRFAPRPTLADEFEHGQSYAQMLVVGSRLFDAERDALEAIELSLSWLAVRAAYGFSRLPDGTLQHFERRAALGGPQRLPVVAVRTLQSDRRWIRRPPPDQPATQVSLKEGTDRDRPRLVRGIGATDRQALIATRRALTAGDLTQQLQALWEAVEFYVGDRSSPGLFSKADRKRALAAVATAGLSDAQVERLRDVINNTVNHAPLMARLIATMADDGVDLTSGEVDVLRRVRVARNNAVHGRPADPPARRDLLLASALLSRALVARMHSASYPT